LFTAAQHAGNETGTLDWSSAVLRTSSLTAAARAQQQFAFDHAGNSNEATIATRAVTADVRKAFEEVSIVISLYPRVPQ
jgi:hypothetical protein